MAEAAVGVGEEFGMKVRILQHDELLEHGMNMLAAVGQAAEEKARLVELVYEDPAHAAVESRGETLCIVGKGVCFDTGGLNLKPTGFIEDMHMDMGGAAAALGAARAVGLAAKAGLRPVQPRFTKIAFVLALAENAIGSDAVKPNAILKSYKGLTVQNGNTDAEGRLCLADAMTWTQCAGLNAGGDGDGAVPAVGGSMGGKPDVMVDVATLTGACVVALGEHAAGK